jgi:hypothetical protein
MKRDLLGEAARALREEAEETPARSDETRARVMASLRKQRSRRVTLVRTAVPLAAVFVGSLAWAAATGILPMPFRALDPAHEVEAPAPPNTALPPPSAPSLIPSSDEAPPETPPQEDSPPPSDAKNVDRANPAPAPHPLKSPSPAIAPAPRGATPIATSPPQASASAHAPPSPAITPPAPAGPDEHALYTTAHRLHFTERNPSGALAAWDAYLRAAPRGRFSVEAHYNRALCLVRLGRAAEARASLERFASGAFGGYRKAEARALLDAMGP